MPNIGSVNQIEPSDLTTTSFGELSGLPSTPPKRLQITVIVPSCSVRVTCLPPCSQVTSRPWRSRVLPLAWFDGLRKTLTWPVSSSQRRMRLFGMSLHSTTRMSPNHTGPPPQGAAGKEPFDAGIYRRLDRIETRVERNDRRIGIGFRRL